MYKPEKEDNIELLFSCAHIVVDVEVLDVKQLLKNQGYGRMVMDAVDQDAKGIHIVIDSNYQQAVTNKLEADFYICNEQSYQNMLKGLVGYMADIDGHEEGQKLINDWIQFHDDWIADHTNQKVKGWAILVTITESPFEGRQLYRLRGNRLEYTDYVFLKSELYSTKKIANRIAAKYSKNSAFGTEVYEAVPVYEVRK